jgi:hypothetical protein
MLGGGAKRDGDQPQGAGARQFAYGGTHRDELAGETTRGGKSYREGDYTPFNADVDDDIPF